MAPQARGDDPFGPGTPIDQRGGPSNQQILSALASLPESDQRTLLNRQKELVAHLFETGSLYTTVVIGAGYAGLFTIWANVKSDMARPLNLVVGICLGLSLAAFVYYEVWKMFHYSLRTFQYGRAFGKPVGEALQEVAKIEIDERDKMPRLYTIWLVIFLFTIATSAVAALILVGTMLAGLMGL